MEVKQIGNLWGENTEFDNKTSGRVYDKNGISPTLNTMQGGWKQPMIIDESKLIPCKLDKMPEGHLTSLDNAKICDIGTETASTVTARYYKGIGAHKDNMCIVAMRGRNPDNPSDRTVGSPTEQRLEPNSQGICNTLTSVQKDNLVMETVRIKQATSQGYIECEVGGVADLSFPESKTRRGRVQENGQVSPTLMAGEQDICRIEKEPCVVQKCGDRGKDGKYSIHSYSNCIPANPMSDRGQFLFEPQLVGGIGEKWGDKQYRQGNRVYDSESVAMAVTSQPLGNMGGNSYMYLTREPQYRIRKLTPRECWRLMDFTDEDFEKAAQVNSNTQLYKQAGNSIVKNVLVAILGQMIPGKEEVYKKE